MKSVRFIWLSALGLMASLSFPSVSVAECSLPAETAQKRIALTFDDAPRANGAFFDGETRTKLLIDGLAAAGVEEAMFFVTTKHIREAADRRRLAAYAEAGHALANHSHEHRWLSRSDPDAYLADIARAQEILDAFDGVQPFFRFPFLDEGRSAEKRDAVWAGLESLGLRNGYVTVDNYDWYLNKLAGDLKRSGREFDREALRHLYLETLVSAVTFYDGIAREALGYSPRHVLLLHENDLAALFIVDLVNALREGGWELIRATEAFSDPIAACEPQTTFLGQGRVAALAHERGRAPRSLIYPGESELYLEQAFRAAGLNDAYFGDGADLRQPQVLQAGNVSQEGRYEFCQVFSSDGNEFYFGIEHGDYVEILGSRLEPGGWAVPERVLGDVAFSAQDPMLSLDDQRLYFIGKADGHGDIWYADRTPQGQGQGWGEPVRLPYPVNTEHNEYYTSFDTSGNLYFSSDRDARSEGDYDLYVARRSAEGGYQDPERLSTAVNSGWYEGDPFIAPDGSFLLFASNRRGGLGRGDLFVSFRGEDGAWQDAVSLGAPINSEGHELCPAVTRDGRILLYTSRQDLFWTDFAAVQALRWRR